MEGMTERQKQVYDIIDAYWDREGIAPSLQDIANSINTSKNNASVIVNSLIRKGYLIVKPNVCRSLRCKK